MRTKILIGILLFLGVGFGSRQFWKIAQEKAAQEGEARFAKPHQDAYVQKRYLDSEAILTAL